MKKRALVIILAIAMVVSYIPTTTINAISGAPAQEQAAQAKDQIQDQDLTDETGTVETEQGTVQPSEKDSDKTEPVESGEKAEPPADDQKTEADQPEADKEKPTAESSDDSPADVQEQGEKAEQKAKSSPKKAPSRATMSGNLSNGWIWKVSEGEDGHTMTFEYTGTEATPPTFEIPSNFIANISSQLGDVQSDIKSIVIPEGCTKINTRAFQNLKNLEEVEIGSTVQTIGTVVFGDNNASNAALRDTKLKTVTFKTDETGKSALTTIEAGAFTGCSGLETINLEDTKIKSIGYEAFRYCAIKNVNIPDTVCGGTVANYAFANNTSMESFSMPAPFYIGSNMQYLVANCTKLEEVEFREVPGAALKSGFSSNLPAYIFQGDNHLKNIDLSVWEKATNATSFTLGNNSEFNNNNLAHLEEITLPRKNVTINTNTFKDKAGPFSMDDLKNKEYITSIGDRSFYGTRMTSADMSDMNKLTVIPMEAFKNCEELTELVIPENVKEIRTAAFKNCDNLEDVRIESKELTTVPESNLFHGDDNLKTVTISDKTKKLNGNVLASIPDYADTFFEGENVIQITKPTKRGGDKPLKQLDGTYYVDSQGVLYKMNAEGKTSLAYCPPGLTSYTVPETFTTPDGEEYTVNSVTAYAFNKADDLTALTFAKPENVYLRGSAFTGWTTSADNKGKTINGLPYVDPDDWGRVSDVCDFPIKDAEEKLVEAIEQVDRNPHGEETLRTVVAMNDKNPSADHTYDYKTGQKATYTIAISNEDNTVMDKVVRVYFQYSDAGYNMGSFPEGEYTLVNSSGTRYPLKVVKADDPDTYYYEITGVKPGETLAFQNDIFYSSPDTGGGSVKIWTKTLTQEENKAREGDVINPDKYMQVDWETTPVVFRYMKSNAQVYNPDALALQSPVILTDPSGEAYVSALAWRLTETNTGSSSTTEGLDYIKWVNYEDEIEIPEQLYWRPEILEALRSGDWTIEDVNTYYDYNSNSQASSKAITVTVGDKKYYVAHFVVRNGYGTSNIDNLKGKLVDDRKLKLTWKVSNTSLQGASATNEYTVHSFFVKVGDGVLLADLEAINQLMDETGETDLRKLLKVHNETKEVRHYSFSANQENEAKIDTPIDANASVITRKTYQSSNNSYTNVYGGKNEFFDITLNNTGILNISQWGKPAKNPDGTTVVDEDGKEVYDKRMVKDTLSNYFFIEPANIEAMLKATATAGTGANAQTAHIGNWLTITINKASLYTPDQYQPVDGTDQTNKYTTGNNSNITHANDNGMRVNQLAAMTFKMGSDGRIIATLTGDTIEGNNRTYTIG